MDLYDSHWILTLLLVLPLVGAAACFFGPIGRVKYVAFGFSVLAFLLSLPLFWTFNPGAAGFQNEVSLPWIEIWGIHYAIGIDGISLLMVLLTTFITPLAIAGSFTYIQRRERAFYSMMLILLTGMLGVFVALDLFLFFVFWEIMLIPMYFLIGIWGGQRRIYSAVKFFLFTAAGSLLMLVAIVTMVYLYGQEYGTPSFAYQDLLQLNFAPADRKSVV